MCSDPKSEGHHIDYDQPLAVLWLCERHHAEFHVMERYAKPIREKQTKSLIESTLKEAKIEEKVITEDMENELGEDYPHGEHGFNDAIDAQLTANLEAFGVKEEASE